MFPLDVQNYLDSFINYERYLGKIVPDSFNLDRMRALLRLLGNPHQSLQCIHVAGSKGKGSTCAMTAEILKHAGYAVGLYTSPHISEARERVRVLSSRGPSAGGDPREIFPDAITEAEFAQTLNEMKPAIEQIRAREQTLGCLTFFEVFTALALFYFHKRQVDFAVLETGLGGRLDATNVVEALVCALTPISLEHTHFLGNTISAIAREKAAIIKSPEQKVVIAPQLSAAEDVLAKRSEEFGISPLWIRREMKCMSLAQNMEYQTFSIARGKNQYANLRCPLLGSHQIENAAAAIGIIECLAESGFKIPKEAVSQGLKEIFWPGRLEIVRKDPLVILDCAHTAGSCRLLANTLEEISPGTKAVLVLGISADKDKDAICRELRPLAAEVILTRADHPRAADFSAEDAGRLFPGRESVVTRSVKEALKVALAKTPQDGMLLVTGSIFVVAEARGYLVHTVV